MEIQLLLSDSLVPFLELSSSRFLFCSETICGWSGSRVDIGSGSGSGRGWSRMIRSRSRSGWLIGLSSLLLLILRTSNDWTLTIRILNRSLLSHTCSIEVGIMMIHSSTSPCIASCSPAASSISSSSVISASVAISRWIQDSGSSWCQKISLLSLSHLLVDGEESRKLIIISSLHSTSTSKSSILSFKAHLRLVDRAG